MVLNKKGVVPILFALFFIPLVILAGFLGLGSFIAIIKQAQTIFIVVGIALALYFIKVLLK